MYPSGYYSKFLINSPSSDVDISKILEKVMDSTKGKQRKNPRPPSTFGKDKDHCLCKVLRPIILLWQIGGVLPVSHDRKTCKMSHKWFSFLAFHNIFWMIANFFLVLAAVSSIERSFVSKLQGIDVYAFSIVVTIAFASTILIFLVGNLSARKFLQAWSELHSVTEEVEIPNFRRVKRMLYILPALITQQILTDMVAFSLMKLSGNIQVKDIPVTGHLGSVLANIIPNLVSGIYVILFTIVRQNFKTINRRLQGILNKESTDINVGKHWNPLLPLQIARFRILHEKLCHAVRSLENAFGLQILAIFTGTCISFITGIYSLIIATQGLTSPKMTTMTIAFGIGTVISSARVVAVIWICQHVMNEAGGTGHVLNNFDSDTCSEEVNTEIEKFLQKLGNFPLRTKCCDIFQIGNGFYSSASSAIVTYVLILIQFRLDKNNINI